MAYLRDGYRHYCAGDQDLEGPHLRSAVARRRVWEWRDAGFPESWVRFLVVLVVSITHAPEQRAGEIRVPNNNAAHGLISKFFSWQGFRWL